VNCLKTNFFETELELGHRLRAPAEGPCEYHLYLLSSKFLTTSEYAPRLQSRLAREQQLAQDAAPLNAAGHARSNDTTPSPPGSGSFSLTSTSLRTQKPLRIAGQLTYHAAVDRDWMRQQLEAFDNLAMRYENSTRPGDYIGDEAPLEQLHRAEPTVKQILRRLDPQLAQEINVDAMAGETHARNQVQRGLGILTDMDEWAARLTPDAPALPADQFHPWVWDAARTFWDSQHYRAAVHAAASAINAHLQAKVGRRDVADDKLVQEAFSDRPAEPRKPRLRVPGDATSPTVQSRQRGALQLGLGSFFAIRNPAAHETGEWTEQESLEQLATLSVLARLIDSCQVSR
jgi:uncharacterized protein (TIGR02391 family)